MPTVDIITPAYNAEKYLEIAIKSVLVQTFQDWRLLLVDDGSTDLTVEIAARYKKQLGDQMLLLKQDNRGPSAARNLALRSSSAPLVALLDADDIWLPNRLAESIHRFQVDPGAGLIYGLVARIDKDGVVTETFTGNPAYAEGWIAPAIYKRRVDFPSPTITFRRECIEAVGLFDETMRATEDRDLWLRIALQFRIGFIPKVIAQYRTSSSSASSDFELMAHAQLTFIGKHYGSPGCNFLARQIALSRVFKQRAEELSLRGSDLSALRAAYRAWLIWPFGSDNLRTAGSLSLRYLGLKNETIANLTG